MTDAPTEKPDRARTFPLLPEQRRFLDRRLPGEHHWNQVRLFRIAGAAGVPQIRAGLAAVMNRHCGLRMCLLDRPSQRGAVGRASEDFPVEEHDLRGLPPQDRAPELTRRATAIQASMSLTGSPLVRAACFTLADGERRLLLVVHHFVCDGLSFGIVAAELDRALDDLAAGRQPDLGPPPPDVADYAGWLTELASDPALRGQVETWQAVARPAEPVPVELPGENTMLDTATAEAVLDAAATEELTQRALPGMRAGVKEAFLAAAVGVLQGTGRNRSLKTNLIGHGRRGLPGQPNLSRAVGWLSTRYPVSVELDTTQPFTDQVAATGRRLAAIPFDGAGFGVLRHLSPDPGVREALAALGEPDITVNYLGRFETPPPTRVLQSAPESPGPDETETGMREHLHGIDVLVADGQLRVVWYYNTTQYRRATVEGYAADLLDRVRKGFDL